MQHKETLSAYMDGHKESDNFAETLCNSAELQQTWANYHTIRSVMRGEEQILGSDFSAKMAALLENEEMETAKTEEKPKGLLLKLKRWSTPIMQAGIAASVCLSVVLGVNMMNGNDEVAQAEQPVLQTLPFTNSVQPVSYNAPSKDQPTAEQLEYQQRRINELLQNHELQRRTHVGNVTLTEEEKQKAQTSQAPVQNVAPQNNQ
ncbi:MULTISPECIES: sigma-E factor negative regulatory protein [Glaesserella]|uniref:Anti-sigma-E factor RseA n=1 Tax=Glaesserella australis TaxID=2094024 RepID=A0A328BV69_9PAST|nr:MULTISPECIES: sigma-E factor negative regulatory protein [Glaesserella]AUI66072.1 transcriptional regulator [Glaesserella sp. 15-184]RAL18208.1 transcriptional regulator [Glaesserella australis]